jgi:hypothetical protein
MLRQLLSFRRCRLKSRFKVLLKMTAAIMATAVVVLFLAMSNDVQTTEQRQHSRRNLRQDTKLPLSGEQTVRRYNSQANKTLTAEQETVHVHLALVVLSVGDTRNVAALLKTVIYFRHVPLYLHVFVNNQTNHIMSTLLGTWQLSRANYSLYKLQKQTVSAKFQPHEKFQLLLKLPATIDKVIFVNNEWRLLSDIGELWSSFKGQDPAASIGLVGSQTCMESEKLTTCWDYNVILCSLTHVRNSKLATQLESAISKKAVDLILADNAKNIFHVNCTWAVDLRSNATHCNLSQNISGLMHSESTSGRLSTTAAVKQAKQIIDMVASQSRQLTG